MLRRFRQEFDDSHGKNIIPYAREIIKILEQARKEVEGEQVHLNVDGTINVIATIESAKSIETLYSDINFMTLLIARVAARMKVNPLLIQHQLVNSWYSRYTGITRNDTLMESIPDYPSKIILNWGELKDKAKRKEEEYNELKSKFDDAVEVEFTPEEDNKIDEIRARVLSKLKEKQANLEKAKERVASGVDRTSKQDVKRLIEEIKKNK